MDGARIAVPNQAITGAAPFAVDQAEARRVDLLPPRPIRDATRYGLQFVADREVVDESRHLL